MPESPYVHPGRAYCDRDHPGGDLEADRWCRDYHRPVGARRVGPRPKATNEAYARREVELAELAARIEAAVGQTRHYGIRVWSKDTAGEWGSPAVSWFVTDPHLGLDSYAFAHYAEGPPPVEIYTRAQYETACTAIGIVPAADDELGTYADKHMPPTLWDLYPLPYAEAQLRQRRLAGLERETDA